MFCFESVKSPLANLSSNDGLKSASLIEIQLPLPPSRVAPPLSFSSGVTLQNGYSNEDIVKKGVGQGISSASDRLSNYLITRAEQYQPVVSIPSGIEVEVVFVEGFHLNGKRRRKPTTLNNRFINRFEDGQR